jgi:hypothetical protein
MKKIYLFGLICAVVLILIFVINAQGGKIIKTITEKFSSVSPSGEYYATSTSGYRWGTMSTGTVIRTGSGTLGSIIITKTGLAGGAFSLYNATTTNVNLRKGATASTTILLATWPTDLAAGTYTFDITFGTGLMVDWTGTVGSTTITWR